MFRKIISWLSELALVWFLCGCLVAGGLAIYLLGCDERAFRYLGGGFQFLGFLFVMHGLNQLRRLFKRPGPVQYLREWWGRRPWRIRHLAVDAESEGLAIQGGIIRFQFGAAPGATIEQRLGALEKGYRGLFEELRHLDNRLGEHSRKGHEALAQEQAVREEQLTRSRIEVERAIVGSHSWEWAGVIVFIFGTVASSFAAELAFFTAGTGFCTA